MIQLDSRIEGTEHLLFELEQALKPIGFVIGDNWEYNHGFFDYKINENDGILFLRIPFFTTKETLDRKGVKVRFGTPFLLNHQYQAGLDDGVHGGVLSGIINQFQEPSDRDAYIPEDDGYQGRQILNEAENAIFS